MNKTDLAIELIYETLRRLNLPERLDTIINGKQGIQGEEAEELILELAEIMETDQTKIDNFPFETYFYREGNPAFLPFYVFSYIMRLIFKSPQKTDEKKDLTVEELLNFLT